jgi:hypothetical protein
MYILDHTLMIMQLITIISNKETVSNIMQNYLENHLVIGNL